MCVCVCVCVRVRVRVRETKVSLCHKLLSMYKLLKPEALIYVSDTVH